MAVRGKVIEKGSPRQTLAVFRRAAKPELVPIVEYWHERYLPEHFKGPAAWKYRYKRRSKKYEERKRRQGNELPLVGLNTRGHRRGQMRDEVTRQITISATGKGARGKMRGPFYLYAGSRRRDRRQPDMEAELTRVTKREEADLSARFDEAVTARMNGVRETEATAA